MSPWLDTAAPERRHSAMVRLLGHRFGDGLVYLRDTSEKQLLKQAVILGLVNPEGYLTPAGHSLLARFDDA